MIIELLLPIARTFTYALKNLIMGAKLSCTVSSFFLMKCTSIKSTIVTNTHFQVQASSRKALKALKLCSVTVVSSIVCVEVPRNFNFI